MASDKQIRANRLNAQRSTGPRTIEGKARSRRNALAHGLTATCVLIPGECQEDYERLREGIWEEYDPHGPLEEEFAERLVSQLWRLRRVPVFESALMLWTNRVNACCFDDDVSQPLAGLVTSPYAISDPHVRDGGEELGRRESFMLGRTLQQMIKNGDPLSKITNYEAGLVRQVDRTMARLSDLIRQRQDADERRDAEDAQVVAAEVA